MLVLQASSIQKITSITTGVVYGLLTVISAIGLLSAIKTNRKIVLSYLYMLVPFTLFSTTLGVFAISLYVMNPTSRARICHLPELQDFAPCKPEIWDAKIVPIVLFAGTGLLQIYGCFAVYIYQAELAEAEKEDAEFYSLDAADTIDKY